jgi:hypothetical protein
LASQSDCSQAPKKHTQKHISESDLQANKIGCDFFYVNKIACEFPPYTPG